MKALSLLFSAAAAASILGCESSLDTPTQDSINESGFFARFDPSASVIPFPNNLLFSDSTDGTVNIPTTNLSGGELALVEAMNSMDGFSTIAPMSATFSSAIDASTLIAGDTVRVFQVTINGLGIVTSVDAELTNTEFVATVSSVDGSNPNNPDLGANKLVITPLKPLSPSTTYMVVLTNGIKGADGSTAVSDLIYAFTKSTSALTDTSPVDATSLLEVSFDVLLSNADANKDGTVDAGEADDALESVNDLEGLRQLTNLNETAIETATSAGTPITRNEMILTWSFTTTSTAISSASHPLNIARSLVAANPTANVNSTALATTGAFNGAGYADIHVGNIEVPYYLTNNDSPPDADPVTNYWRESIDGAHLSPLNPTPIVTTMEDIPLLVSVPNNTSPGWGTGKPGTGWPVVIFQHGITADRTSLLAIADSLAERGFAAVAIDFPLHGLLPTDVTNIRTATAAFGGVSVTERTFDVDAVNNTTGLPGSDGSPDTSGANFINLSSMMTTRDNVYQSVADLFTLTQSLFASGAGTGMSYDGDFDGDFDPARIYYIGHSLGGIIGSTFLAIEPNIKDAVLAMPGGGIAKLLDGSASFGPVIEAGLGLNGVNKGTAEYESFLASAQMIIDGGDPINYTSTLAASTEGILLFEVVGDGANNQSDLVVPNTVPDATSPANTIAGPVSGTEPMISNMQLDQYDADNVTTNLPAVVKFTAGHHSSLLQATDADGLTDATSEAVMTEMQYQAAEFLLNDGALDIGAPSIDTSLIIQVAPAP